MKLCDIGRNQTTAPAKRLSSAVYLDAHLCLIGTKEHDGCATGYYLEYSVSAVLLAVPNVEDTKRLI